MKKQLSGICFVFMLIVILMGCSNQSSPSIDGAQKAISDYIGKNFNNYSGCTFDASTKSYYVGNNIYQTVGNIKDEGGWNHTIAGEIQYSPNGKEVNICYLSIDNKVYFDTAPAAEALAPSVSEYPSNDSISFSMDCGGPMKISSDGSATYPPTVNPKENVSYLLTIKNDGALPINYLTFEIKGSSSNINIDNSANSQSQLIVNKDLSELKVNDSISPGKSITETFLLSANTPGNYNVKFYPHLGDPSLGISFLSSGTSGSTDYYNEADFVVAGAPGNSQSVGNSSSSSDSEDAQYPGYKAGEVAAFAEKVKQYISADDKSDLSDMISYPISVKIGGSKETINSADDFIKNYSRIINSNIKKSIEKAPTNSMFNNDEGIMFGNGDYNIWFSGVANSVSNSESSIKIVAINS